jgi:hypothetical protein
MNVFPVCRVAQRQPYETLAATRYAANAFHTFYASDDVRIGRDGQEAVSSIKKH